MKYIIIPILTIFITSCNNTELEILKMENAELQEKLTKQQGLIESTENALIIPFDSLHHYFMPLTFGPDQLDVDEKVTFRTTLAWSKLPNGINVEWTLSDGKGNLIEKDYGNDLMRDVEQKFITAGEKETYGDYILKYPNGKTKKLKWGRFVTVNK